MTTTVGLTIYTEEEWLAEGTRIFGPDMMDWKFVCPVCKNVASVKDFRPFKEKGATPNSATSECIGRYNKEGRVAFGGTGAIQQPCDYAGYGLFRLSPVRVQTESGELHCFAFAEGEEPGTANAQPPAQEPHAGGKP